MKKLIRITVIFLFFCVFLGQIDPVYGEVTVPSTSAVAAIVIDGTTGRVLYEKNAGSRQLPASTTKIMTALLAIESGCSLDEKVEASEKAAATEGSSIYMEVGEKISFEDLLYALMLRSGNDSGVALAEHIAGSTEKFADMMNARAKEIGARNTNFVTVNGLHDENHFTTAYDMAVIAREAMKNELFRRLVASKTWNASRDVDKYNYFYNKNKVLYQYEGGNGIKIGYTTAAGRCLVASSERNGMNLICVVFAAPDWFNDTYKLMDHIYDTYEAVTLIKEGEPIAAVNVENGEKSHTWLVSDHDIVFPRRVGEQIEVSFEVCAKKSVQVPLYRGDKAGEIIIYYNGEEAGRDYVVFREDIDEENDSESMSFFERLVAFFTGT